MVTTLSKISPLKGLKTTHWYLTGKVTKPVPSRMSPEPIVSTAVTATTNPCRPLWKAHNPLVPGKSIRHESTITGLQVTERGVKIGFPNRYIIINVENASQGLSRNNASEGCQKAWPEGTITETGWYQSMCRNPKTLTDSELKLQPTVLDNIQQGSLLSTPQEEKDPSSLTQSDCKNLMGIIWKPAPVRNRNLNVLLRNLTPSFKAAPNQPKLACPPVNPNSESSSKVGSKTTLRELFRK